MTIKKTTDGNKLVIALEGRLDTVTAPALEDEIKAMGADVTDLVIDLDALEYISSAGLRVLLKAQKTMVAKGTMVIKNACEAVKEVFDITGFSDILTIE